MASNLVVARGGVEFVPPISLAFWRWTLVFLILLPFTYLSLKKNYKVMKKEYKRMYCYKCQSCMKSISKLDGDYVYQTSDNKKFLTCVMFNFSLIFV